MRTKLLFFRLKDKLRKELLPVLPLIRSIRTFPERFRAKQRAVVIQRSTNLSVCYLTRQFPSRPAFRTEMAHGGEIKMTFLSEVFPHSYPEANILYTVSSVGDVGKAEIVNTAKKAGLKIVLNQNGVAYRAWHGPGWELMNNQQRIIYKLADFIVFQSEFCKLGAQKFLGDTHAPFVTLFNPVDLNLYQPVSTPGNHKGPVLLLGGNQYEKYRFESAVMTLKEILKSLPDASLIITGKLWGEDQYLSMEVAKNYLHSLGLLEKIKFTGPYSQQDAPQIFNQADILIHTKFNDPSPNLISEALACGLPVVYSASGGTPELVGEAGIGIDVNQSWDVISLPDPVKLATAASEIWLEQKRWSEKARSRAEREFSLSIYIQKHKEIFENLAKLS